MPNALPEMMPVVVPSPKLLTVAVPVAWMAVPANDTASGTRVTIGDGDVGSASALMAKAPPDMFPMLPAVDLVGHGGIADSRDTFAISARRL